MNIADRIPEVSPKEEETKRRRDGGRKPFLCATAGRDLCSLTAQPCCDKIECAFGAAARAAISAGV